MQGLGKVWTDFEGLLQALRVESGPEGNPDPRACDEENQQFGEWWPSPSSQACELVDRSGRAVETQYVSQTRSFSVLDSSDTGYRPRDNGRACVFANEESYHLGLGAAPRCSLCGDLGQPLWAWPQPWWAGVSGPTGDHSSSVTSCGDEAQLHLSSKESARILNRLTVPWRSWVNRGNEDGGK